MKKILMLMAVCVMLTGCGTESKSASNEITTDENGMIVEDIIVENTIVENVIS